MDTPNSTFPPTPPQPNTNVQSYPTPSFVLVLSLSLFLSSDYKIFIRLENPSAEVSHLLNSSHSHPLHTSVQP